MHVMNDCDFFFLAGAQIIRKENCFFLPSEKITVTWQCFDHFVNKVRNHLVIKRFRQIAMEQPIRVMRCESNVTYDQKRFTLPTYEVQSLGFVFSPSFFSLQAASHFS